MELLICTTTFASIALLSATLFIAIAEWVEARPVRRTIRARLNAELEELGCLLRGEEPRVIRFPTTVSGIYLSPLDCALLRCAARCDQAIVWLRTLLML